MPYGWPVAVLGDVFRLTHTENSGVAFGLLSGTGLLPATISVVATLGLVLFFPRAQWGNPGVAGVLGIILGGAVGNLTDRLADGTVTDFLDFNIGPRRWVTFNLADVTIVLGVTLLAFTAWYEDQTQLTEDGQLEGEPDAT